MQDTFETGTPDVCFRHGRFSHAAGTRDYKLYRPASVNSDQTSALIVMLHGCRQNPDDFATGTRMNQLADRHGCLVLYPAQSVSANESGCWNWFNPADQQRGQGEPAIIAGLTRQVMVSQGIDPGRVYVAGLSAGGAMAVTLIRAYPDLYVAVAVHSGLPHACALDLLSAFGLMRQGAPQQEFTRDAGQGFPAIVFHGDCDTTVHPGNAALVIAQTGAVPGNASSSEPGRIPGGYAFTRTRYLDRQGRSQAELWLVHGAGHGWFGGDPVGSYTEPRGPDASSAMLRFFDEHHR